MWLMNVRIAVEEFVTPESIREANASIYVALCRRRESNERERDR
jgi:hypothetical protein